MGGGTAAVAVRAVMVTLGLLHLAGAQAPTDVPPLAAILLHGAPVANGNLSNFHWRRRRDVKCEADEYKHPKEAFCCKKCIKGFRKVSDCKGKGQVTECGQCESGSYTEVENYQEKCMQCERCNEVLGQIVHTPCTSSSNIVCGCPDGKFQVSTGSDFYCKDCTECSNGKPMRTCDGFLDTICQCHHGFFNDGVEGACRPCNECLSSDCRAHCPSGEPVAIPESPEGTPPYLIALVAILGCCLVVMGAYILWRVYWREMPPCSTPLCSPESAQPTKSDSTSNMETGVSKSLYLPVQPVSCSTDSEGLLSTPYFLLPDCVSEAEKMQLQMNPQVLYAVVDNVPTSRWKEFVRRLGLRDCDIERIDMENRRYRDAQYEMLQTWRQRTGAAGSTVEVISRVLVEMDLSGCSEAIQDLINFQPRAI